MKRRHFIFYTVISTAAVSIPFLGCSSPDPELDKKLAIPETLAQTYDEKTIREIGEAYGKTYPAEYSINDLEKLLIKTENGKSITGSETSEEIRSTLNAEVKNDFQTGDTLVLNGWILSKTEARQCALFTLINTKK